MTKPSLGNADQTGIVVDNRERTNVLVLAGPGSGKTRVLVHRIAYLIRVRRQDPRGILALVYNRHAATEIRRRLFDLLGEDARGVTVSTCHGLAMRLVGASFAGQAGDIAKGEFDKILKQAVALLRGDGLTRDEAEAQRDTLIEGYRWILVDEYQDIGPDEYELIAAIAGRSTEDEDSRLSLFAVGDDDQNIYAFKGASVAFIRRFEEDYTARPVHLIENYRSTANIVDTANMLIAPAADRMKVGHDIVVNRSRRKDRPGGDLERLDPIGRGRVQILRVPGPSNGEDGDADRRLYYVAMTRARRGLALLSMGNRHPFNGSLDGPAVAHRAPDVKGLDIAVCRKIYRTLNPSEVVLDFAGQMANGHRTLQALDSIAAGDPVGLKQDGDRVLIVDRHDIAIGRLAKKFEPPKGATLVEGSVHAITTRYRSDSAESFQPQLRRDRWSVVLPELVYTP